MAVNCHEDPMQLNPPPRCSRADWDQYERGMMESEAASRAYALAHLDEMERDDARRND